MCFFDLPYLSINAQKGQSISLPSPKVSTLTHFQTNAFQMRGYLLINSKIGWWPRSVQLGSTSWHVPPKWHIIGSEQNSIIFPFYFSPYPVFLSTIGLPELGAPPERVVVKVQQLLESRIAHQPETGGVRKAYSTSLSAPDWLSLTGHTLLVALSLRDSSHLVWYGHWESSLICHRD